MENRRPPAAARRPAAPSKIPAICIWITAGFCGVLLLIMALFWITPDRASSESENRVLQQKPKFTLSAVADGSFMKDFETYMTDQFPLRDGLIGFHSFLSEFTGARKQQNVIRAKTGRLIEAQTPVNEEVLNETLGAINAFKKKNADLQQAFLLAPNASDLFADDLPYGMRMDDRQETLTAIKDTLKGLTWISASNALKTVAEPETLYYRTDHHWTTRAAFACFLALNQKWKLGAKESTFAFYPVTDSFSGTLASSYGDHKLKDTIEICIPKKSKSTYIVEYASQQRKTASLFEKDKLAQKNQYEVFLGGNYDKVVISTVADTTNTLLLFKDSYANCFLPMLTPYFSKIVVIDPRYFSDSLSHVMEENDFTHVLFLYNLNTFLADKSLAPVLQSAG